MPNMIPRLLLRFVYTLVSKSLKSVSNKICTDTDATIEAEREVLIVTVKRRLSSMDVLDALTTSSLSAACLRSKDRPMA
ncbi:hypothetical protein [Yoonia sp. MH D7]